MAKSTHGQEIATGTSDSYTEDEVADPTPPVAIQRTMLGELKEGDSELVGMDSSELSESERQPGGRSKSNPREPAQTTENLSDQTETGQGGSTARTTVGAGRRTAKPQSGRGSRKANIRSAGFEDDNDFE